MHLHTLLRTADGYRSTKSDLGEAKREHGAEQKVTSQVTDEARVDSSSGVDDAEVEAQMAALAAMNLYDGEISGTSSAPSATHEDRREISVNDNSAEEEEEEETVRPGHCLLTCCGDRVFCVHSERNRDLVVASENRF